ncbi:phytoene/squalene synthase family protein [Candidatus Vallotia cooleyia]|uniref:phytoene/squalene synthase family protein n=1 Tax=Candidatus Vallotiella adelgis TaxID=1177211 RepID=UPI001D009B0D|nr:phytoene/squalene synthase family protein [Candidatus Vallotia cooleyia]UDG82294.1 All-trans-phytoene synthase [Candidatus Vallotia cooleyia]
MSDLLFDSQLNVATERIFLLGPLLKSVSRSFYLTLCVLPTKMREPVALAYLLARAADTIADTPLIDHPLRPKMLSILRAYMNGDKQNHGLLFHEITKQLAVQEQHSDELILLASLEPALIILQNLDARDREAVCTIVSMLVRGMEFDLNTFPHENSGQIVALSTWNELDEYTYMVGGCVGEFWTEMIYRHLPRALIGDSVSILELGVRFGRALQLTNVLRDCAKDLRIGRCYLPSTMLKRYGLTPQDMLSAQVAGRARPVMQELVRHALDQFYDAIDYTLAIRRSSLRLRLACLWPIAIGLKTLLLLVNSVDWLTPNSADKIRRRHIYSIIAISITLVGSNTLLRAWMQQLITPIEFWLHCTARDGD